nr:hypothetical protein B0A51_11815 [Rachicladosporium sp. CCFEE 5018]
MTSHTTKEKVPTLPRIVTARDVYVEGYQGVLGTDGDGNAVDNNGITDSEPPNTLVPAALDHKGLFIIEPGLFKHDGSYHAKAEDGSISAIASEDIPEQLVANATIARMHPASPVSDITEVTDQPDEESADVATEGAQDQATDDVTAVPVIFGLSAFSSKPSDDWDDTSSTAKSPQELTTGAGFMADNGTATADSDGFTADTTGAGFTADTTGAGFTADNGTATADSDGFTADTTGAGFTADSASNTGWGDNGSGSLDNGTATADDDKRSQADSDESFKADDGEGSGFNADMGSSDHPTDTPHTHPTNANKRAFGSNAPWPPTDMPKRHEILDCSQWLSTRPHEPVTLHDPSQQVIGTLRKVAATDKDADTPKVAKVKTNFANAAERGEAMNKSIASMPFGQAAPDSANFTDRRPAIALANTVTTASRDDSVESGYGSSSFKSTNASISVEYSNPYNPQLVVKLNLNWNADKVAAKESILIYLNESTFAPTTEFCRAWPQPAISSDELDGFSNSDLRKALENIDNGAITVMLWCVGGAATHTENLIGVDTARFGPHAEQVGAIADIVRQDSFTITLTLAGGGQVLLDELEDLTKAINAVRLKAGTRIAAFCKDARQPNFQSGQTLKRNEQPRDAIRKPLVSFPTYLHAIITEFVAAKLELDFSHRHHNTVIMDLQARVLVLAGGRTTPPDGCSPDGEFVTEVHVVFDVNDESKVPKDMRFQPGQSLTVALKGIHSEIHDSEHLNGTVVERPPGAHLGDVWVVCHVPKVEVEDGGRKERKPLDITLIKEACGFPDEISQQELSTDEKGAQLDKMVSSARPILASLKYKVDYRESKRLHAGFTRLQDVVKREIAASPALISGLADIIRCHRFDRLVAHDALAGIDTDLLERIFSQCNDEQRTAFEAMRACLHKWFSVDGPAGCGKTHMMILFACLQILDAHAKNEHASVVVVSPLNENVNSTVKRLVKAFEDNGLGGEIKIVRVFTRTTEASIRKAFSLHAVPNVDKGPINKDVHLAAAAACKPADGADGFPGLEFFYDWYDEVMSGSDDHPSVRDKRVKDGLIDHSLGMHVAKAACLQLGQEDELPETPELQHLKSMHKNLVTYLIDVHENGENATPSWTAEDKEMYGKLMQQAEDWVMANAHIVVSTPSLASDEFVFRGVENVRAVLFDEAARISTREYIQVVSAFAHHSPFFASFGDHRQLASYVQSPSVYNNFAAQLGLSLVPRLTIAGWPTQNLVKTLRFGPDEGNIISRLFYGGRIVPDVNHKYAFPERRKKTLEMFNVKSGWFAVNVKSEQKIVGRNSTRINCDTATKVVCYALNLIYGCGWDAKDIIILTAYDGQRQLIRRLISEVLCRLRFPKLEGLTVETIDKFQGSEREIVIVECTASDTVGHIGHGGRLLIALSRAKSICILVGALEALMDGEKHLKDKPLGKYIEELKRKNRFRYMQPATDPTEIKIREMADIVSNREDSEVLALEAVDTKLSKTLALMLLAEDGEIEVDGGKKIGVDGGEKIGVDGGEKNEGEDGEKNEVDAGEKNEVDGGEKNEVDGGEKNEGDGGEKNEVEDGEKNEVDDGSESNSYSDGESDDKAADDLNEHALDDILHQDEEQMKVL